MVHIGLAGVTLATRLSRSRHLRLASSIVSWVEKGETDLHLAPQTRDGGSSYPRSSHHGGQVDPTSSQLIDPGQTARENCGSNRPFELEPFFAFQC